ncbi:hypothetical protein C9374_013713, partial [Naegleria lovaniensis]
MNARNTSLISLRLLPSSSSTSWPEERETGSLHSSSNHVPISTESLTEKFLMNSNSTSAVMMEKQSSWKSPTTTNACYSDDTSGNYNNYFRNLNEIRNGHTLGGSISVLSGNYTNYSSQQNCHDETPRIYEDVCVCSPLSSSTTPSKFTEYPNNDEGISNSSFQQQNHHGTIRSSLSSPPPSSHNNNHSTPTELIVSAASANSTSSPTSQVFYWTLS